MTDEAVVTPQQETTPTPAKTYTPKPCATCGEMFTPTKSGREKWCSAHRPDEKSQKREQKQKERKRNKAKAEADSAKWNSTVEVKKAEAIEILKGDRLIRNQRAAEACWEQAVIATRALKLPLNAHIFTHGISKTLDARSKKKAVDAPEINDVWYPGERVREHELYCMWDYACGWRTQPDGAQISFDQWKEYRRRCVTDLIWFGNTVLGKDFQPEPHGKWADELFPKLEPALMSLPEKFGQKDIAEAFYKISDVRQRCLIAARSSYKSTVSLAFLHQINLAFAGSVRCLILSATQPLARGFATNFRNTYTLRDVNNLPLMLQLWPEHAIDPDDGKALEYTSPFRQLDMLIEPTVRSLSIITEGSAGGRYDYACYEDCAEISNSSTPEMRAKTQERVDMLRELGEPHSLTNYVGTPISAGAGTEEDPGDLYSVLLRREERNKTDGGDPKLLYVVSPAWTVKEGISKKAWDTSLTEDEVDLLFPSRLTFKYLMGKLKENLATDKTAKIFRQQSLVEWTPDAEEGFRVQFGTEELRARTRLASFFDTPIRQVFMGLDRAFSLARTADFSALVVMHRQPVQGRMAMVVADCKMERWRESDIVKNAVDMMERQYRLGQPVSAFFSEQDRNWETLANAIRQECLRREIPVPYFRWKPIQPTENAKARRIKAMELPLSDGRLWFVSSSWTEQLLLQFENYTGGRSRTSAGRKDDGPDACSLVWQEVGPKYEQEVSPEDAAKRSQEAEEEANRERQRHFYSRMFSDHPYQQTYKGSDFLNDAQRQQMGLPPRNGPEPEPEPARPADPRDRIFSYSKSVQPSNVRNQLFGVRGRWRGK